MTPCHRSQLTDAQGHATRRSNRRARTTMNGIGWSIQAVCGRSNLPASRWSFWPMARELSSDCQPANDVAEELAPLATGVLIGGSAPLEHRAQQERNVPLRDTTRGSCPSPSGQSPRAPLAAFGVLPDWYGGVSLATAGCVPRSVHSTESGVGQAVPRQPPCAVGIVRLQRWRRRVASRWKGTH